jgi:hypothetical protein
MTRSEFCDYVLTDFGHAWSEINLQDGMPLWIPEERDGWKASYFAVTPCLKSVGCDDTIEFWEWCRLHLSKTPLCYMSNVDHNKEWWGFNTARDMSWFILRWVK